MKRYLRTLAVSALFLASASVAHAQISLAIRIGAPPPPRAYRVPPQPARDFLWVEGYWYPQGKHYVWHDGYWTRPPYEGAYWVAPYHIGGEYYQGHWEGGRGVIVHDHRWDKSRDRDEHHERDEHRER